MCVHFELLLEQCDENVHFDCCSLVEKGVPTCSFQCWKRLILGILPLLNLAKNGGCYLQLSTDSFFSCCKHYCKIQMGVHCIIVVRRFFLLLEKVKLPFFVH